MKIHPKLRARALIALMTCALCFLIVWPTFASNSRIKGTAALSGGLPVAGGLIHLVDNDGKTASTTINAKGKFSIKTGGLAAPFLLKATSKDSTVTLYGFAVANGTANVNVYTDLIVSMVYAALSTDPNTQFGLAAPVPSGLSPSSFSNNLSLTSMTTQNLITSWLLADKVKMSNFNLLDNKLAVNNSKFGKLLRQTTIKTPLTSGIETIEITDNITVQDITFAGAPPVGGSLTGTVSGAGSTSINSSNPITNALSTSILVNDEQAAEFDAVNAVLQGFEGIVNSKRKQLAATDIQGLFNPGYLRGGENMMMTTADLVTGLRGQKLGNIGVIGINSIAIDASPAFNDLNVLYNYQSGKITAEPITEVFQCPNPVGSGTCVFWGNQQLAQIQDAVQLSMLTNATLATPNASPAPALGVDVLAPSGTLSGVSIDDATHTYFNANPLALADQVTRTFIPTVGAPPLAYNQDESRLVLNTLSAIPPAGMNFSIAITPVGGSSQAPYVTSLNGSPGEPINLIQPSLASGNHALTDAPIGQTAIIKWELPTSYPVQSISLTGQVTAACGVAKQVQTVKSLSAKSTSAMIKFPAQVSNPNDIQEIDINLGILGVNGAVSRLVYAYGQCS